MWSTAISAEKYTLHASRYHARGDCFLYGYYNSEQQFVQVKICTAVDKEKGLQKNKAQNGKFATKSRQMLKSQCFSAENC